MVLGAPLIVAAAAPQLVVGSMTAAAGSKVIVPLWYMPSETSAPAVLVMRLEYPHAHLDILEVVPGDLLADAGKMLDYEIRDSTFSAAVFGGSESVPEGLLLHLVMRVAVDAPPDAALRIQAGAAHGADAAASHLAVSLAPGIIALSDALAQHSADVAGNWRISAEELQRVIQLYRAGAHHCDAATSDGYAPGPGDQSCTAHDADYRPLDWRISFEELLRMVQLHNAPYNAYHRNDAAEDGFAVGPFGFHGQPFMRSGRPHQP